MHKYLVLLETSGNQTYVFATNKLKENIGASELTWRAGCRWVLDAVKDAGGPDLWDPTPADLRTNLADKPASGGIEVVIATSGKAILVVDDRTKAEGLVEHITRRALLEAPGLDLCGAIVGYDPEANDAHTQIKAVHERHVRIRGLRPYPLARHTTLPPVERCASSGRPAATADRDLEGRHLPLSLEVSRKRDAAEDWHRRIYNVLRQHGRSGDDADVWVPRDLEKLERAFQDMDWLAVVHADGNGVGQIFLDFKQCSGSKDNDDYLDKLRCFSLELDAATETAFVEACRSLPTSEGAVGGRQRPLRGVVPLVLGGDDLTVLMDGRYALSFARAFLAAFERKTAEGGLILQIAQKALNAGRLSACAGVALIKPHFPFHNAYDLAEALLTSAKTVKQQVTHRGAPYPCSALDFHILFDSVHTELDDIRKRLSTDGGNTHLNAAPYVVTPLTDLVDAGDTGWAEDHHLSGLLDRVKALSSPGEDGARRAIPNSQAHVLREALFQGRKVADGRFAELHPRYPALEAFFEGGEVSLFRRRDDKHYETRFLDALTSASFWCSAEDL